jgi:hypothetical protein
LAQNPWVNSAFYPDPGAANLDLNRSQRSFLKRRGRGLLRNNATDATTRLDVDTQRHKTRRPLRHQVIHRLAPPCPKQTSADLISSSDFCNCRAGCSAGRKNLGLLIRRPIPPLPPTRDYFNTTVLSVLMTVLMPNIRTVIIHNLTSSKSKDSVFKKSTRAARWDARIGYACF